MHSEHSERYALCGRAFSLGQPAFHAQAPNYLLTRGLSGIAIKERHATIAQYLGHRLSAQWPTLVRTSTYNSGYVS